MGPWKCCNWSGTELHLMHSEEVMHLCLVAWICKLAYQPLDMQATKQRCMYFGCVVVHGKLMHASEVWCVV